MSHLQNNLSLTQRKGACAQRHMISSSLGVMSGLGGLGSGDGGYGSGERRLGPVSFDVVVHKNAAQAVSFADVCLGRHQETWSTALNSHIIFIKTLDG